MHILHPYLHLKTIFVKIVKKITEIRTVYIFDLITKYSLFYEVEGNLYLVSVIEGFFFNRDQNSVRNRGVLVTELKKVTDQGFCLCP